MTCSASPDTIRQWEGERDRRPGLAPRQAAGRGRARTRAPVGHVPRQASQARTAELLPPLLLFHVPQERHLGGVEWPRLPSLWSPPSGRAGTQDSRPPFGAWLVGTWLCTPRRGGSLSPVARPGDFSSVGGTVSIHGPGRESFSLSRVR